ncbi:MAG TPA: hypothetical protein VEU33_47560, partial [Archangium sp.]|nr:hypothetical protein [Archangium sp.]
DSQSWMRVGMPLSAYNAFTFAGQPRIQATASGKLFIAWREFDGNAETGRQHLFASHWSNDTWNILTTPDGINQGLMNSLRPMLAIDSSERAVVAWYESHAGVNDSLGDYLYVRRYNK